MSRNITYPGKEDRVVTALTWDLYQNGEISFDEVMDPVYTPEAQRRLSEVLTVPDLLLCPFEESFSFIAIRLEEIKSRGGADFDLREYLHSLGTTH